jgi:hypothetical protein
MKIQDETIGTYVGLNDTGEVVQYFSYVHEFENRIDSVVSVGYVEARVTDYEQLMSCFDGEATCDNCRHQCAVVDLDCIDDLYERIDAGSFVPAGQCPKCGSLSYVAEKSDKTT